MGFDIKDQLKEHKKILLPGAGIIVLTLILVAFYSNGMDPFNIDTDITGNGNSILDGSGTKKTYTSAPAMTLVSGKDYTATIKTEFGNIVVDLFEKDTPMTVNSFVFLSKEKFYNGLTFHRIVKDFVIQGGDPKGDGTGDPGYKYADEIDTKAIGLDDIKVKEAAFLKSFYGSAVNSYLESSVSEFYSAVLGYKYTPGKGTNKFDKYVLAMANSGPGTNGSQFFITTGTFTGEAYLNGKHTVFGRVVSGFDVVDAIEDVNVKSNDKPTSPVVIKSIEITTK